MLHAFETMVRGDRRGVPAPLSHQPRRWLAHDRNGKNLHYFKPFRQSSLVNSIADSQRTVAPAPPNVGWTAFDDEVPLLPNKLTPSQAARLAEILDYLHKGLTTAVENIDANEDGTEIRIGFAEWQTIQAVQMLLARYARNISEPTG